MRFQGKVSAVTGAASGIGLACAVRLAREGANVALLDLDPELGRRAARSIEEKGGSATFIGCDVGIRDSVENAFDQVTKELGPIDILVSNAGIGKAAEFLDFSEADFDLVIQTNLKGMFLSGQAAARRMVDRGGGGSIVNMSSINAIVAMPTGAAYAASKGGVRQLTCAMAVSLARHGIRVNAVGPGTIETELTRKGLLASEVSRQRVLARTPLGRCGQPEEVASVVAFVVFP